MPQLQTTVGQLLVNEALPEPLRDYERQLDKKTLSKLLERVAREYPDEYRRVSHDLANVGRRVAYSTGGFSFGLRHLQPAKAAKAAKEGLQAELKQIEDDDSLNDEQRDMRILKAVDKWSKGLPDAIYKESLEEGNPLARQIASGARGNPNNLASLRGADFLYTDHRGRVLPLPVLRSYSEGLRPVEYWAGTYGARKGTMDVKFCVSANELVLMSDYTEKAIQDIRRGEWVMGADRQGRLFPVRVVEVWDNGERPCYRYRFRKGSCRHDSSFRELVATEEHRVLAQIKAGRPGSTYESKSVYLPTPLPLSMAACRKDPKKNWFVAWPSRGEQGCPDRVDEPRALLAGLMLGDGCMSPSTRGQYSLSCGDPRLLTDLRPYLRQFNLRLSRSCESQYGYNLVEIKKSERRTKVVHGRNSFTAGHLNETKSWLRYTLGEELAHDKTIPELVWTWNDRSLADLLGGIFSTDGNIERRNDGCSITLSMTSCQVVTQVQRLLELRLGIWTSALRRIPKERMENAKHDQYEITISHPECVRRFAERVSLVGSKREELLDALTGCSTKAQQAEYGFKIHSKEFVGSRHVYDLEVDHPDHLYCLASGLIVHNSTQDAGYLAKQLNQIAHRAVVVDVDGDGEPDTLRGYPTDPDDPDNEGALLAAPVGGYPRNTILTPKVLADLRRQKVPRMLVRSPISGGTADGGVYARDVGVREFGSLPTTGSMVGMTAVQALAEPLSQAQLSSKHSGGVASSSANRATGGFERINQMLQVPKTFKGGAAHAEQDGSVESITEAPAGGHYVQINGRPHYVGTDFDLKVKVGDKVEAGDVISEGLPNPAVVVQHKGIGEGRRYFTHMFREAFRDAGIRGHRRNIELLAQAAINHVRLSDELGDYAPNDVVPYSAIEHSYQPREGFQSLDVRRAANQYLERPYLHYTIGTKVRPSVIKQLQDFGIKEVDVHAEPPGFQPEMIRGMSNIQHDPDWVTRMYGSGQKASLLDATHRGAFSDPTSTSFVPGLAKTLDFGRTGKVITPKPQEGGEGFAPTAIKASSLVEQARELRQKLAVSPLISPPQSETFYGGTPQETYTGAYGTATPDGHGYTPQVPQAWSSLTPEQQQQHVRAIGHAMRQLQDYERRLPELPPTATTGSSPDLRYLPNASETYTVPADANGADYRLPSYGDEITDITSVGINPWAWNPQRFVQRYNKAVQSGGPMHGETLVRSVEAMRQAYPEAWQQASQQTGYVGGSPALRYTEPAAESLQAAPSWNDAPGYQPQQLQTPLGQYAFQYTRSKRMLNTAPKPLSPPTEVPGQAPSVQSAQPAIKPLSPTPGAKPKTPVSAVPKPSSPVPGGK